MVLALRPAAPAESTVDNILAGASRIALLDDHDDDLLVIPVDELRAVVESHL